ncbi:hypothetical protein Bbelb_260770 [Branchiostoma belcheri]|nr:hypothetical protein Bbelb_260770 [Branchiostoma belcheri]
MSTCRQTDNNGIPTPEDTHVYSVSDTTKAENSAMYTASGENEEDANAIENIEEEFEPKVMQEDSTVADDSDIAVATMSDHENYLMKTTTACFGPQGPHRKEFPNPIYEENVSQQASDDTSHDANVHVHNLRNPTNAEELPEHRKPVNRPDHKQASDDTRPDSDVHKVHNPPNVKERHGLTYGIITGADYNIQASPVQEVNNLSTLNATEVASITKYTIAIIQTFDGTNPKIGTINGTTPPRAIDGTKPPILGTIDGTNPLSLGTTDGPNPPNLQGIDGTNPPSLQGIDGTNPANYKKPDELIVIDDAFYGRREKEPRCGCNWLRKCDTNCKQKNSNTQSIVRQKCQGLQQCEVGVESEKFRDPCLYKSKYLEVTHHCEEKKDRITFGGAGTVPGKFQNVGGLAVSSTNEIFVTDEHNKRIQVFSMKGVFLRNFPTGNLKPHAISTGRNDTLWVALYRNKKDGYTGHTVRQYSKEGHVLSKCIFRGKLHITGLAWHKLSDRIILTIARVYAGKKGACIEDVWFRPTYTLTQAPKLSTFGSLQRTPFWRSIAIDEKGNIFITHRLNSPVRKYDKNLVYLTSFDSKAGDLFYPSGITVDKFGRVIVGHYRHSKLEMFTAEGKHIRTVAYVWKPRRVATGGEGQLVVLKEHNFVSILLKY